MPLDPSQADRDYAVLQAAKTVLEYVVQNRLKADGFSRMVDRAKDGNLDPLTDKGAKDTKRKVILALGYKLGDRSKVFVDGSGTGAPRKKSRIKRKY